ncbi:MAG: hypothetical protein IPM54_17315 [Polyangiaceae bacterium]|nr:hypothetical protein [Polyangiaceae bacterium]
MIQAELNTRLNQAIGVFLTVLRAGWHPMTALAQQMAGRDKEEVLADWAQANWEMIVEAAVAVNPQTFIEQYGEGAECNARGYRVWEPDAEPTHAVHCVLRDGNGICDVLLGEYVQFPDTGLQLDRFASRSANGWYLECPPFDHVLLRTGGRDVLVPLKDVRFTLKKIE